MKRSVLLVLICCFPCIVLAQMTPQKAQALTEAQNLAGLIDEMSIQLWDYSETAMLETASAAYMTQVLEREGFTVERGVADMPTAFIGSYGQGRPIIGVLAEYDALPGVGNAAVPERAPRTDGVTSGQGCGHNLFGAASVGGAIALKRWMAANNIPGTIRLYGTPAEETVVGKVYMAKAGVFDDLDISIDWHPGLANGIKNQPGRALNNFEVEFFGQAAHSSADPWNGRSALDAVELMNYGVNLMREHIMPSTRIHYVIPNAGEAPNVVPEYAKVWYYVRDINRDQVNKYYQRILNIAEGAALGTGTTHKVFLITGVHETLLNRPLQEAAQANLELLGEVDFTEEEQRFAKQLQNYLQVDEVGLRSDILPLADGPMPPSGGSTDVAEVSWIAPNVGFSITTAAAGIPWHSWATSACHGTTAGRRGAQKAAQLITLIGADLFTNPDLVRRAQAFFQEKTQGKPYISPIPQDQKPPVPVTTQGG